jgi:hypothetical protein
MSNISTALAIQGATKEAMYSEYVMEHARDFVEALVGEVNDQQIKLLFKYSSVLSAAVASKLTEVLMTESDFNSMMSEINEFEEISKTVDEE